MMTYKTCELVRVRIVDEDTGIEREEWQQRERDCTPEEVANIEARKASVLVNAAALFNADIDAQIATLEQQSLMPRFIREYAIQQVVTAAAALSPPVSPMQLITQSDPAYSAGFAAMWALNATITALRHQRK